MQAVADEATITEKNKPENCSDKVNYLSLVEAKASRFRDRCPYRTGLTQSPQAWIRAVPALYQFIPLPIEDRGILVCFC